MSQIPTYLSCLRPPAPAAWPALRDPDSAQRWTKASSNLTFAISVVFEVWVTALQESRQMGHERLGQVERGLCVERYLQGLMFRLGPERNDRIGAPATTRRPPSRDSTTGARQTANESLSIPLSQPPAFPFPTYLFSSFSCTLGNDDRLSAAAARHSYAPEHSPIHFSLFSLTFSFFSFHNLPAFGTTTTRLLTHPRHRSSYHGHDYKA
jgi:hypothetical protein